MRQNKLKSIFSLTSILFFGYLFLSFSGNPPNGLTGAPPTNNTCANNAGGCHATGNYSGILSITGLPATIMTNTTYSITVSVSATSGNPVRGGFQITPLNASNSPIGSWTNPGAGVSISGQFAEHSGAKSYSGGMVSWTVDWTSPSSGSGAVTLYASSLMGNGSGTGGDHVVTGTATGTLMGAPAVMVSITNSNNVTCFGACDGSATAMATGGVGAPYTYSWSNGQSGATTSNLCVGSYTVTATDGAGASATAQVSITQPTELDVIITNSSNITCTNLLGSAMAMASGGTPGYTYNWSNGQNGSSATFPNPGTYTVTVTDVNQCTDVTQVTIIADTQEPIANAGSPAVIDCNNATITLNGAGSSTGPNIQYLWTGPGIVSGANTLTPTVNTEGNYTLTVTDTANGCTSSDQTTVTEDLDVPVASAGSDMSLDCNNAQVTLDGSSSSQGANYAYLWSTTNGNIVSGATTLTPIVDAAGIYTIVVTDANNGCFSEDFVTVTEDVNLPISTASTSGLLDCFNVSVTVDGTGSSTGANISYQWTGPCIISGANSLLAEVACAGTYVLLVTDDNNGCTAESSVTVSETIPPSSTVNVNNEVDCNGNNTGSATITASNGNPPYSYEWSTGTTTATDNMLPAGMHSFTVTDQDGCTSFGMVTIAEPAILVANSSATGETGAGANDGTATASPTGGTSSYSFNWSNGETTSSISGLMPDDYTVTVTDMNGCSAIETITVSSFDCTNVTVSIDGDDVSCNGGSDGSATANLTNGITPIVYAWSNGEDTQTISNLEAGTYTVTVLEGNNCEVVANVTIEEPPVLSLNTSSTNESFVGANDGAAIANAMGGAPGYTYLWSNGATTDKIENLAPGDYCVTITDQNGCTKEACEAILPFDCSGIISTFSSTNVSCNGAADGMASIQTNGGSEPYSYIWSDGGTTQNRVDLEAGNYEVTCEDANGCNTIIAIQIDEPAAIVIPMSSTMESILGAGDGTATVSPNGGTGGFTFEWDNGATTPTIENLSGGTYCVTVTDQVGCTEEGCVEVSIGNCGAILNLGATSVLCNGESSGSAYVVVTGGMSPFTIEWSNGMMGDSIVGLAAGVYEVTATDPSNCELSGMVEVTEPSVLELFLANQIDPLCEDDATGSLTGSVQGGVSPYLFEWSTGSNEPTISNLSVGTYSLTVMDANNCIDSLITEVVAPPDTIIPTVLTQNITLFLDVNGVVEITADMVDNGTFDNCQLEEIYIDVEEFNCDHIGTNTVIFASLDASGNCGTADVLVEVFDTIPPTLMCPMDIISTGCGDSLDYDMPIGNDACGDIEIALVEGLPSGSNFPNGTTTNVFNGIDLSGNEASCSFTVTINSDLATEFGVVEEPTCFNFNDGFITVIPSGGTAPYSILWSNGVENDTLFGIPAGVYDVSIIDALGCKVQNSVTLDQPDQILINIDGINPETGNNMDGSVEVTVSGGTNDDYTYEWSLDGNVISTDEDIFNLDAGEYVLVVTDGANCMTSDTAIVDFVSDLDLPLMVNQLNIQPNPTYGTFNLNIELEETTEMSIDLFDYSGKLILEGNREKVSNKSYQFDLSKYPEGVYMIRIFLGAEVLSKKIIVSRS